MKREADGEMGSPQKRSRRGEEEVRLLIPSKAAGSIIGKGGQNITKLRNQYNASITVPDCPGPERMLTISADHLQTICNIITDIIPNLEQNGAKVEDDLDLRMMIHQSQAGCVIGRAGAKIKELRTSTGARIKIFSNCAPQSTDRIIQINGQDFQCIKAISEIIKLMKTTPIKGPENPYNSHNYDDFYAEEYGGYGSGGSDMRRGGGGGAPRGQGAPRGGGGGGGGGGGRVGGGDRFGGRAPPPPPPIRGGPSSMGSYGGDRGLGAPPPPRGLNNGLGSYGGGPPRSSGLNGNYERSNGWSAPPLNGGGLMSQTSSPMSMMGQMSNNGLGGGLSQGGGSAGKSSTQVTIPKDLAGAIIGKGGTRIRKIRQESGAGITIDEPLPGSNDRIITISGLANQIQMAQYLLQQSVHNNAEQRNGY